jgi:hypothetical protein
MKRKIWPGSFSYFGRDGYYHRRRRTIWGGYDICERVGVLDFGQIAEGREEIRTNEAVKRLIWAGREEESAWCRYSSSY